MVMMGAPVRLSAMRTLPRLAIVAMLVSAVVAGVPGLSSASPGSQLWVKRYDGPSDLPSGASALATSPDGSEIFVTGAAGGQHGSSYATLAYDPNTGTRLWVARYDDPGLGGAAAVDLEVSPDGSTVFVTGSVDTSDVPDNIDYATVAYDASNGDQLWAATYDGPTDGNDDAADLAVSPDGSGVFVTGHSGGPLGPSAYATVAYDASNGAERWVKRYPGPGAFAAAAALGVSPDGSKVFVTGESVDPSGSSAYGTVAYDASTGDRVWLQRYARAGARRATALGVSPDGSKVFVTGVGGVTTAFDAADGGTLWATRYHADATALVVSPDGSFVFVTGYVTRLSGWEDYATAALDAATGARAWVARYGRRGVAADVPGAIGVSPDGSEVFVTGFSKGLVGGYDYATLAYGAATGSRSWVKRYDGPGHRDDLARALAVSPDGSEVFVTGTSGLAYATVAYGT